MKYVALLRGINVGGNRKVEMKKLKSLFEMLGFKNVSTYINSGNIIFETNSKPKRTEIEAAMEKEFGFAIQTLVKTKRGKREISQKIPADWKNNATQKTDLVYLFREINHENILDELPVKRDFVNIRYVPGTLFWNVKLTN